MRTTPIDTDTAKKFVHDMDGNLEDENSFDFKFALLAYLLNFSIDTRLLSDMTLYDTTGIHIMRSRFDELKYSRGYLDNMINQRNSTGFYIKLCILKGEVPRFFDDDSTRRLPKANFVL